MMNIGPLNWFLLRDLSSKEVVLVTLIKAYIHKSRLKSSNLSIQLMMQSIKFEISKEYHIAKRKNKVDAFEQRWGDLQALLP